MNDFQAKDRDACNDFETKGTNAWLSSKETVQPIQSCKTEVKTNIL